MYRACRLQQTFAHGRRALRRLLANAAPQLRKAQAGRPQRAAYPGQQNSS